MPEEQNLEDRTESPTQFRREEFRRSGTVALSREVVSFALLAGCALTLYFIIKSFMSEFSSLIEVFFNFRSHDFEKQDAIHFLMKSLHSWTVLVGPLFLVAVIISVVSCAAQVGFIVSWEPLGPDWEKINPFSGFKRVFSARGLVEAVKAVLKISLAFIIGFYFIKSTLPTLNQIWQKDISEIAAFTLKEVGFCFFMFWIAYAFLSALDYGYQRFQLERQLRMTKREAKEEFKLREGDPLIRQRIRSLQRKLARSRMMDAVPKADVVVTNPTHFAIALQYDVKEMPAPKVVAKGQGLIAQKIKEIAALHNVPMVENKPLARTLFKEMEINQFIPKELYKAVAEVLAYVYRLKNIAEQVYG